MLDLPVTLMAPANDELGAIEVAVATQSATAKPILLAGGPDSNLARAITPLKLRAFAFKKIEADLDIDLFLQPAPSGRLETGARAHGIVIMLSQTYGRGL